MRRLCWPLTSVFATEDRGPASPPRRARPQLEALEERAVPATFLVSRAADDPGPGSLRWAITQANNAPGLDEVRFSLAPGSAIRLASELPALMDDDGIDVVGPGRSLLTVTRLEGAARFRILTVASSASRCSLSGMTISNGSTAGDGGGILNEGALTVRDCLITGNRADLYGGGILNGGGAVLSIIDCDINENQAERGGGLHNAGQLELDHTILRANTAALDGGGIDNTGSLKASNQCELQYNRALAGDGGGLYSRSLSDSLLWEGGFIHGNTAGGDGGGIYQTGGEGATFRDVDVRLNAADKGGGVYVFDKMAAFTDCFVEDNTATELGAGLCYKPRDYGTYTFVGGSCQGIAQDLGGIAPGA